MFQNDPNTFTNFIFGNPICTYFVSGSFRVVYCARASTPKSIVNVSHQCRSGGRVWELKRKDCSEHEWTSCVFYDCGQPQSENFSRYNTHLKPLHAQSAVYSKLIQDICTFDTIAWFQIKFAFVYHFVVSFSFFILNIVLNPFHEHAIVFYQKTI